MAFSSAITKTTVIGDVRLVTGTYATTSTDTGGTIETGLNEIFYFNSNCETSQAATVNKVVRTGGSVVITHVASEDGQWVAIGV
jgi:hypothetical protein